MKMLFELLAGEPTLTNHFCTDCAENGVAIEIDPAIDRNDLLIIRVDGYYNTETKEPEKSPDCLVIQRCEDNQFTMYIIELKNIKNKGGFSVSELTQKFTTCLDDFMSIRFGVHFHDEKFVYKDIRLFFISDPYGFKKNPERQVKMRGHKLDALMALRIPRYFNKHLYIQHKVPNPMIRKC